MQTKLTYAFTMATAAVVSSTIAISVSEFSEPWMIYIFPFLALVTGGLSGWIIPARVMERFGGSKSWAALSGIACAFISMTLCASSYVIFLVMTDLGAGHLSSDFFEVLLFCNFVTQIACGLFAYPIGALAGLAAYRLDQNKKGRRKFSGGL